MRTALVTGASRGIGLELCRQLKGGGYEVTAVCRAAAEDLADLGCRIVSGIDVTDPRTVGNLASLLQGVSIDLLVNNAGILIGDRPESLDFDDLRRQFEVNALGPLAVTRALAPRLRDGGKVAMITSRMGSIADNSSGGYYGYRVSKAALNMLGVNLAHELRSRGIAVLMLHPGMVATEMTGRQGIPVEDAAAMLIERIEQLGLEQTGTFWHANGERLPW
ncbi:MAG TPA: SDR family oxidoreductase [Steroidobacteraceae bacterium]|nr:SDR family oxidoreductase [Steroidobacteraceae bacterium]